MGSYSFKSSGKTQEQTFVEALNKTVVPVGIKTPLRLGEQTGIFDMHTSLIDQVNDNLRNLILTNWGEHLGIYDFGANLRPLCTELVSPDDFDAQAVQRISRAVSRWMPFVTLEDFVSSIDHLDNKNTGIIHLTITYTIPTLKSGKRALEVTLYVI